MSCATVTRMSIFTAYYRAMCLTTTARRSRWTASRLKGNDPYKPGIQGGRNQELPEDVTMNLLVKIFVMIGSSASIGFGIWHFFVPEAWKWYSYIDINATELVAAVRAINAFFSLSLVLFGMVNILLIFGDRSNRYSIIVMLAATCILWLTRVAFQVIYPQGSLYPGLQYGMLSAFIIISLCYVISLMIMLFQKPQAGV
jgi:hypothetical protein